MLCPTTVNLTSHLKLSNEPNQSVKQHLAILQGERCVGLLLG